ncbi:MAG: 6,7-dimethyl-8-ribityllumazine synthase [Planctomycetota bacterium]
MAQDLNRPQGASPARPGVRVTALVSTYHLELCSAMAASAREEFLAAGMAPGDWTELPAPGAFELPILARAAARRDDVDCVLCFGLVLTGETSHDHWVSMAATQGILQASLETDKPVLFGVLTCQTLEQARMRALPPSAGGKQDKGREVARAALLALDTLDRIQRA